MVNVFGQFASMDSESRTSEERIKKSQYIIQDWSDSSSVISNGRKPDVDIATAVDTSTVTGCCCATAEFSCVMMRQRRRRWHSLPTSEHYINRSSIDRSPGWLVGISLGDSSSLPNNEQSPLWRAVVIVNLLTGELELLIVLTVY